MVEEFEVGGERCTEGFDGLLDQVVIVSGLPELLGFVLIDHLDLLLLSLHFEQVHLVVILIIIINPLKVTPPFIVLKS